MSVRPSFVCVKYIRFPGSFPFYFSVCDYCTTGKAAFFVANCGCLLRFHIFTNSVKCVILCTRVLRTFVRKKAQCTMRAVPEKGQSKCVPAASENAVETLSRRAGRFRSAKGQVQSRSKGLCCLTFCIAAAATPLIRRTSKIGIWHSSQKIGHIRDMPFPESQLYILFRFCPHAYRRIVGNGL